MFEDSGSTKGWLNDTDGVAAATTAMAASSANPATAPPSSGGFSSLLERLMDDAPDVFQHEVLPKLWPNRATALALLRRVSRRCKAAVEAAGEPIAGFSEGVKLSDQYCYTSVELFEWARSNGMPMSWRTFFYAAKNGGVVGLAQVELY
jgi:hypothetical protein